MLLIVFTSSTFQYVLLDSYHHREIVNTITRALDSFKLQKYGEWKNNAREQKNTHSLAHTHTQCLTLNNFVDTKLTTIIRREPNELSIIANVVGQINHRIGMRKKMGKER